jgi:hypothetical protein
LVKAFVLYSRAANSQFAAAVSRREELKARLSKGQLADAEKMLAEQMRVREGPSVAGPKR